MATVLKSFEVTGIAPLNPSKILDRFIDDTSEASGSQESSTSCYSGEDWLKIQSLIRSAVKDERSKESRKLNRSLHHISIQNELLHHEMKGMKEALSTKKMHKKKAKVLPLQQREEYYGGAVFWSPSKRREAEFRYEVMQRLEMEKQLEKVERKELKKASKLYKEKLDQGKRVAREALKVEREKAKADKAKQAAERARQQEARNAEKSLQLPQKGKRKASRPPTQNNKRQKREVAAVGGAKAAEVSAAPPTVTTSRGRSVNLPSKYR